MTTSPGISGQSDPSDRDQPSAPSVPPGWYPTPGGGPLRWWDGTAWSDIPAPPQQAATPYGQPLAVMPVPEKSSGLALLFTILWPGAGHMYLGLVQKGTPYVVANAIGFVLALTLILIPISFIIWLVTMLMLIGGISDETEFVNQARREGRRVA